jgi:DNA-binding Lrp family transcriptional regulator
MVSEGVIQEFIADVNFAVLGYRICYIITKQEEKNSTSTKDSNSSNRRRKIVIDQLSQIGDILAEIEILGETSIFRLAIREPLAYNENTPINDNISSLIDMGVIVKVIPVSSSRVRSSVYKQKQPYLTPTELKILRCLVSNPQIGIADIANVVAISARTANRILNKLKDDRVVRFSVICNPSAMKGLVVFGLLIYVNKQGGEAAEEQKKRNKKPNSHKILERLYTEFPEYPFLRSPIISHDNIIILSVFGNDVFAIDSMFKRILSFQEVRKAELYVFTRIKYHKEWILREIDNKLESKFQSTFQIPIRNLEH